VTDNTDHEPNTPTDEEADRPARARTRTRRTTRTRSGARRRDGDDARSSADVGAQEEGGARPAERRGPSTGDDKGEAGDEPKGSGGGAPEENARGSRSSDGGDGEGKRRRRRGRRGRGGRSRGGGGGSGGASAQQAKDDNDTSTKADAKGSGTKGSGDKNGGKGGSAKGDGSKGNGSGKGGSGKGASGKDTGKGGSGKGDATSDADREMQEAIAKGGTRAAAKRGRQGGSGRASGGRRGQRPGGVPEEVRRAILEGPPRTMLVTSREDRTQIAVLEDRSVVEHYVTRTDDVTLVGNIYMARVQNVLPGMEAAFLDIGKGRNGVLYAGEVLYDELDLEEGADERIENALKSGQKVLVQVTKDPMGSKGPRLTMHLSLAGRFMVLAPNSDLFGISRKLTDKERDRLRKVVKQVKPDHHGVIVRTAAEGATEEQITADVERLLAKWARVEERAADAKALSAVYEEPPLVVKVIRDNFGPEFERCIVDSEELYHQVREYLGEVAPELLDKVELYGAPTADARARAAGAPASAAALRADADKADADAAEADGQQAEGKKSEGKKSDGKEAKGAEPPAEESKSGKADATPPGDEAEDADERADAAGDESTATEAPATDGDAEVDLQAAAKRREELPALFVAYDVTEQLRKATSRKVWLPSGGYLIIETTEAMKVIDVNTGKFTGGKDTNLEEVVLKTNLEAADEIVRQLRLRDMGGIIIIDFIDMLLKANQEQVVRRLKRELLRDRTKTRVSDVSQLGLVQMTRKNVSQGLLESFSSTCEHCDGRGVISELDG
jgi:Ribonuclease G/E